MGRGFLACSVAPATRPGCIVAASGGGWRSPGCVRRALLAGHSLAALGPSGGYREAPGFVVVALAAVRKRGGSEGSVDYRPGSGLSHGGLQRIALGLRLAGRR